MKTIIFLIILTVNYVSSQSTEIKLLEDSQSKFENIIRAYEDSLAETLYAISELKKSGFQNSIDEGHLIVYSKADAPLRSGPSNFDSKIKSLPKDSKLLVTGNTGIYLHIESEYGKGYISENLVNEQISATKISKNVSSYKAPVKRSYSSLSSQNKRTYSKKASPRASYRSTSYRSYIRGPRGGCYYINSNGNKSYVSRSLCN